MSHTLKWGNLELYITFEGAVTSAEVLQAVLDAQSDPRAKSLGYTLNDFERCNVISVERKTMDMLAVNDWTYGLITNPALRIALFPARADVYKIADAYTRSGMSLWSVRVFENAEAARSWASQSS